MWTARTGRHNRCRVLDLRARSYGPKISPEEFDLETEAVGVVYWMAWARDVLGGDVADYQVNLPP